MSRPESKKIWLAIVLLSIQQIAGSLVGATPSIPHVSEEMREIQDQNPLDASTTQRILDATIQIYMISEVEGSHEQGNEVHMVKSLGSLIYLEGENFILTHDHWWFIEDVKTILFYDSGGEFLMEISAGEFLHKIQYRDAGTMLVTAPEKLFLGDHRITAKKSLEAEPAQLPIPARLDCVNEVREGQIVYSARQSPVNTNQVSLLASRVQSILIVEGIQVFILKSLNGESIIRGDSGGGIWQDGCLVGNTWRTSSKVNWLTRILQPAEPAEIYLDRSTAAQIPIEFFSAR
jgi:hypothetical protein